MNYVDFLFESENMTDEILIRLTLWGVRGSIPTPLTDQQLRCKQANLLKHVLDEILAAGSVEKLFGKNPTIDTLQKYIDGLGLPLAGTYGGNTTCFEIQMEDSPLCIVDAGSGIRALGDMIIKQRLMNKKNLNPLSKENSTFRRINLFLTHYHWDHIQGFPFFAPAFMDKVQIRFYGKDSSTLPLDEVLRGQQASHYFPVLWKDLPCRKECIELGRDGGCVELGNARVLYAELDHPGGSFGYAFEIEDKKVAIVADAEPIDILSKSIQKLAKDCTFMYWDGQYLPEEYSGDVGFPRHGWGHGTYEHGIECALMLGVKCMMIGHLEPKRDDFGVKELERRALNFRDEQLQLPKNRGKKLDIVIAQEGMAIEISKKNIHIHNPNGQRRNFSLV